jgi:hypothetical protein
VVGTDVTLIVNGASRAARTDAGGRATFPGLAVGATVIAKVLDEEKAEHPSEQFTIPSSGGMRVMLTTKPWQPGAGGGAPFAGGGAGMPNPRQLSGEGRAERGDPAGTLTVRVTYDDFKDTPAGVGVVLIGYSADDTTSYQLVKTDSAGRAQFADLDRSGGTSYFAMTVMPRNGAFDRLTSMPVILESQSGVRMVLSSDKRDSKAPAIDDLNKMDPQVSTPAGKVRVVLEGEGEASTVVKLIDAATKQTIAEAKPQVDAPDSSKVQSTSQFGADPSMPAGTIDVLVIGGAGQAQNPLPNLELRVIPAGSSDSTGGVSAVTSGRGITHLVVPATGPQKVVFTVNGSVQTSQPFELTKSGGKMLIRASWEDSGRLQAMFDVAPRPDQAVYAECSQGSLKFRSIPFQLLDGAGSKATLFIYPRTMFRFKLQASVEDELLATQGRFEVMNNSWSPYRAGPDGLIVPLPRGFKGGVVFGNDQSDVSVVAGEGFRIVRPIPPGGRPFNGGFSLAVDGGKVGWSLDLPLGVFQSELYLRNTPEMKVQAPPGVGVRPEIGQQGDKYTVLGPFSIAPKQSMVMAIEGLPSEPAWRGLVRAFAGVVVICVLAAGVFFALYRKSGQPAQQAVATSERRRQALLDQLVELERTGANPKRRDQLLDELEQLWG